MNAVHCQQVEKSFGTGDTQVKVLRGVDFTAAQGEMTFLVGPSGCGKTTLITERQQRHLEELFSRHPALRPIYDQMQRVCSLMRKRHQKRFQCKLHAPRLIELIAQLTQSGLRPLVTLAKTLQSWQEEIACMWRFTKNNGITEGFHRKMKLIQRRAYGFRNFNNYRLRVIAQCG